MSVNEKMVQDIVQEVVAKMQISSDVSGKKGVFSFPRSDRRSKKMLRFLHVWVSRKQAWEMSDIKF